MRIARRYTALFTKRTYLYDLTSDSAFATVATEAGLTAPIHIRPRSAPVKLGAPPPSRSAPHKLDLQPQYGIRPHYRAPPQSTFAPIHIRPRSAPVKLDAPPPSRSAPHKLDLQPQYGIRPTIAWTHRPLPDPPHTNWTYSPNTGFPPRTAPTHIRPSFKG